MTSTIKVNKIEKESGSTLTLGGPGTAVTLACGATQTGFGASGAVNWCSTIYTNSPGTVTATSGKGFFLNTTSGTITINLPSSPSVGDIVAIKDYANTFDSNNVTVGRGGSKIGGNCLDAILNTEGQSITLIYADSTKGWLNVNTDSTVVGNAFIEASGGNATITCGNFKTHIFTADGPFNVTAAGQPSGSTTFDYVVVAGGGGGGYGDGGGGGAGGFRLSNSYSIPAPTMSPLVSPTGITAAVQNYTIAVGGGGSGGANPNGVATAGEVSTFGSITSAGGGRGSGYSPSNPVTLAGDPGGSGSGASGSAAVGNGNTPPVSPPQGNNGGAGGPGAAGGGGGAGAVGGGSPGPGTGGTGGIGSFISDTLIGPTSPSYGTPGPVSSTRYFAGGAGGYGDSGFGPGISGGGGDGGRGSPSSGGTAGTVNTGGGGGPGTPGLSGATGGSGIVVIRYKFQ